MDTVGMFQKFIKLFINNFTFDGNHYLQINGTAMGTKMAPSYANIFMGDLEEMAEGDTLKTVLRMTTTG
jgi:hypothetical protein